VLSREEVRDADNPALAIRNAMFPSDETDDDVAILAVRFG
jgi:hypothetical protein